MPAYSLAGRRPQFEGNDWYLAPTATIIGSVSIGASSSVWPNAVLRGDDENIVIGSRSNVQDGSVLHADPGFPLILESNVTIGHMVMLHGCLVGENSLVGIGSVVLNGAKIGKNSLLGAGALVPEGKTIPEGVLAIGSPARIVRELSLEEIARLAHIAQIYVDRAHRYRRELTLVPVN
jgi:carbonic anhydrase/acetyltransferase-like protein (isoleucine patch superfamily)